MFGWRRSLLGLSSVCVFGLSYAAHAAAPALGAPMPSVQGCTAPIARVIAIQGEVRVRTQQQAWQPATIEQALCAGDELQVAAGGRGALRLGATTLPLDQNTHLILRGHSADGKTLQIELVSGNINVATDASSQIQLITPHGKVSTTGGDFAVSVTAQQAALSVFGGKVAVSNPEGNLELQGDETAFFAQWSEPKRDITVKTRDSVQWVVQYPALLASGAAQSSAWAEAAQLYEQGRVLDALIALDQVPKAARSADYHVYRANILLLSGRAGEALADIEQAKKLDPNLAEAWALQVIFDLGQNDSAKALAHAEKSVKLNPNSPAAQLAHSYALQANRRPDEALASARRMVELAPDNALGHTRVAELELAHGDRAASLRAARRGVALAPNSTDAQSILGFAYLSEGKDSEAQSAFDTAVRLNSADPRARMGLGLVRIRQGRLQAGREDLELAASLDPENALLRAYLGRAYAEEGRTQDAAEQYVRAQRSDPQDPTTYFFSALLLAESNQPVSAQTQMQEALARNENRAVYRGQALLEEDIALRKANEISMDRQLGFDDAARAKASDALVRAPNSGLLHRALGDAMATLPRSQPTRESEYLQALLRDPLGVLPTPLFVAESVRTSTSMTPQSGFFQAIGAGQTGYNDFGAVFHAAPLNLQFDGVLADQNTSSDQVRIAGTFGKVGFALSQLLFKTDGFGQFDRLDNIIWQGAIQAEFDTGTRLYVERRHFNSERRSVVAPAEPFFYTPLETDELRLRTRFGLRQKLGESHELLLLNSWDDIKQDVIWLPTPYNGQTEPTFNNKLVNHISTHEAQYVFHASGANIQLGSAEGDSAASNDVGGGTINRTRNRAWTAYAYVRYELFPQLLVEAGVSKDRQSDDAGFRQRYNNPKVGLRWQVVPSGTLRLASFRVVNRFLANSATLEPSQVAGFNQFYNDGVGYGIRARNKGVGWDQMLGHGVSYGAEILRRTLDVPVSGSYNIFDERSKRAYLNWAVPSQILKPMLPGWEGAFSLVYDSQTYRRNQYTGIELIREYTPRHLRLGATLTHSGGLGLNLNFTRVSAQGIYHEVNDEAYNPMSLPFSDKFWMVDAALSYRLPGRMGQVVLGAMNLTDQRRFQYLEMDPLNPRFAPQRYVYGKVLFKF